MRRLKLLPLSLVLFWSSVASQAIAVEQQGAASSASSQKMTDAEEKMESEIQTVWKQFLSAAERGDTSAMLKYIAPGSLAAETVKDDAGSRLQQIARNHKGFGVVDFYLPYVEGVTQIQEADGDTLYPVHFMRVGKEWLITSF